MDANGKNGRCPCGSGRAFGDCCQMADHMAGAVAASVEFDTEAKRLMALGVRIGEWALDNPRHLLLQMSEMRYFYLTDYSRAEREWVGALYSSWLLHDFELGGVTLARCVLEERGEELALWERQGLEVLHRQICGRRVDRGFRLVEVRAAHGGGDRDGGGNGNGSGSVTLDVEDLYLGGIRTVGTQCIDDPPGVGDLVLALIWPLAEGAELLAAAPVPSELAPVVVRRIGALFTDEVNRLAMIYKSRSAEPPFDRRCIPDLAEENVFRCRAPQVVHAVIDAIRTLVAWHRIRPLEAELAPRWAEEERRMSEWCYSDAPAAGGSAEGAEGAGEPTAEELMRQTMGHYRVLDLESLRVVLSRCELVEDLRTPGEPETGAGTYLLKSRSRSRSRSKSKADTDTDADTDVALVSGTDRIAQVHLRQRHMWVTALWSTPQLVARRIILEVAGDHVAHVLDEQLDGCGPLSAYRQWEVLDPAGPAVPD